MIRFLLNVVRVIISIYLCALIILTAYFLVYKKLYDDPFPLVFNHSYIKVDNDYLIPDYEKNEYMIVKHDDDMKYEVGDYIEGYDNKEYNNGTSNDTCNTGTFIENSLEGLPFELLKDFKISDTEMHYFDVYRCKPRRKTIKHFYPYRINNIND